MDVIIGNADSHSLAQEICVTEVKRETPGFGYTPNVDIRQPESADRLDLESNGSTISAPSSTNARTSDQTAELEKMKGDLLRREAYVLTLRSQLEELRMEHEAMQDCAGRNKSQSELEREFRILQERIDEKNKLLGVPAQPQAPRTGPPPRYHRRVYGALFWGIYESCAFIGDEQLDLAVPTRPDVIPKLAEIWAERVSGRKLEQFIAYTKAEAIPTEMAFACLVGAAIFQLVFQPVFANVFALDQPLLYQLRRYIFTKCGPQLLHEHDHGALKLLINTKDANFTTKILPETANSIAEFIVRVLQIFLSLEESGVVSSNLSSERFENLLLDLGTPLHQALKMKVEMDLSKARINFVYFKPGSAFNSDKMERDTTQQLAPLIGHQHEQQTVKICLLPALFALPPGDYNAAMGGTTTQYSANCNMYFKEARVEDPK
ncbi:hypothetical protein VFPPC_12365 [Pochonia chlamydosporia 170]|uniref:Uncharacterized protein n=1 Tax=Pochonia chlamydosporia 170 TaxID=1380566 RepID=A0A179EWP9_METCM|nr:hypothetical protein VFPPC_12365 [Pochonia chlamydosporia 170]OAQ57273.2 hypothetical protein VFPPC_12365 [Pochonia chlamydosporia 170]